MATQAEYIDSNYKRKKQPRQKESWLQEEEKTSKRKLRETEKSRRTLCERRRKTIV